MSFSVKTFLRTFFITHTVMISVSLKPILSSLPVNIVINVAFNLLLMWNVIWVGRRKLFWNAQLVSISLKPFTKPQTSCLPQSRLCPINIFSLFLYHPNLHIHTDILFLTFLLYHNNFWHSLRWSWILWTQGHASDHSCVCQLFFALSWQRLKIKWHDRRVPCVWRTRQMWFRVTCCSSH